MAASNTLPREAVVIETASGPVSFEAEIARTPSEQAKGLMFRQSLGEREGMLFVYPRQVASMWMKNTYISLDMLFIDEHGRIVRIARETEPFSAAIITSGTPVTGVLEIGGGLARRLGIAVGDRVRHPHFPEP
ncbi:MAG: DUF192 domain-containing protein [Rhizobiales bacterium]|nr:DUF192 domain-containing protein [Hyphomicrobiales bacterium]